MAQHAIHGGNELRSLGSVDLYDLAMPRRVKIISQEKRAANTAYYSAIAAYRAEKKLQKLAEKLNKPKKRLGRPPKIRDADGAIPAANEPTETIQIDQREFNQILSRYASALDDFEYDRFSKIVSAYLQHLPGSAEAYHAAIRAIGAKGKIR